VIPSHVIPAIRSLPQAHPYVIVHTKQKGDKRPSTNSAIAKQAPIDARKCAGKGEGKNEEEEVRPNQSRIKYCQNCCLSLAF
jgi:hypothetical protein